MDMTPHFPIYMDYGATTPVDQRVVDAMVPWLREHFGNPASRSHAWGWEAEAAVEKAREEVAALVNADPREIVWTSGATESINLALKGAANFYKSRGKHVITLKTEHKAVLDSVRELERQGFDATYLDVQEDGLVDLQRLASGQLHQVQDAFFKSMVSLARLQEYVNKVKDPEIGALLSVQKEFGPRIPGLVEAIQAEAVETEDECDVLLTTAHRCKGLEWHQVLLCDDFEDFEVDGGEPRVLDTQDLQEELNLLYVAATRASHALEINSSITGALKALGTTDFGLPEDTPESIWVDALIDGVDIPEQECELRAETAPASVAQTAHVAPVATASEPAKPVPVPAPAAAPIRILAVTDVNPFEAKAARAAVTNTAKDVRVEPVAGAVIAAAERQVKPWLDRTRFRRT